VRQRLTSWAATIVQAETQNVVRMSRSASTAAETKDGHPDQLGAAADIMPRGAADAADSAGEARKTQSRTVDTARGEKAGHLRIEKGGHWVEKWFVVQDTMIRCSWHHCASALSPGSDGCAFGVRLTHLGVVARSIFDNEEGWHAFQPIAVVPVDLCTASDPKVRVLLSPEATPSISLSLHSALHEDLRLVR
jgi:hypothetical protein